MTVDKSKIVIIGAGGLGSNMSILLAEQGCDVLIVDDDTIDEKFINRFVFFQEMPALFRNRPKVTAIQTVARKRKLSISVMNAKVDEDFDLTPFQGRFCIIAVDKASVRGLIEARLKTEGLEFVHIGCNLNSISIFNSMSNVIADDPDPNASTSYDVVPDAATYFMAATQMANWLRQTQMNIDVEEPVVHDHVLIHTAVTVSELDQLIETAVEA